MLSVLRRGAVAIAAVAYSFYKTPEERRHTLQIGVSIGVAIHGRRVPVKISLICKVWLGYRGPTHNNRSILVLLL
jgi:hypothetical protein